MCHRSFGIRKEQPCQRNTVQGRIKDNQQDLDDAGAHDEIIGIENIDKVIDIDQSPIGRTPRSNPATYTGMFTHIKGSVCQPAGSQDERIQQRPVQFQC